MICTSDLRPNVLPSPLISSWKQMTVEEATPLHVPLTAAVLKHVLSTYECRIGMPMLLKTCTLLYQIAKYVKRTVTSLQFIQPWEITNPRERIERATRHLDCGQASLHFEKRSHSSRHVIFWCARILCVAVIACTNSDHRKSDLWHSFIEAVSLSITNKRIN